ncbi:hypothetical protein OIO90_004639 [Microbotryomycetes sp. JL221]|nr:hypothetical protein OIO90_004639 [Microbotryomycetes sp. JL221]
MIAAAAAVPQVTQMLAHSDVLQPTPINPNAPRALALNTNIASATNPGLVMSPPSASSSTMPLLPLMNTFNHSVGLPQDALPTRESSKSTETQLTTPTSPPQAINFAGMSPPSYAHSLDPVSCGWPSMDAGFAHDFPMLSSGVDELFAGASSSALAGHALFPTVMPSTVTVGPSKPGTMALDSSLANFAA